MKTKKEVIYLIMFWLFLSVLPGSIVMFIIGSLNTTCLIFSMNFIFNIPIGGSILMLSIGLVLMIVSMCFLLYINKSFEQAAEKELEKKLKEKRRNNERNKN